MFDDAIGETRDYFRTGANFFSSWMSSESLKLWGDALKFCYFKCKKKKKRKKEAALFGVYVCFYTPAHGKGYGRKEEG